jgi:damage-control phosphatase, subfamily I
MKIQDTCRGCLQGLVRKTVTLSGGTQRLLDRALSHLDTYLNAAPSPTPPAIANKLLFFIREQTGVWDPYATIKYREYKEAMHFLKQHEHWDIMSFGDLVRLSALGNSTDFFVGGSFSPGPVSLDGPLDVLEDAVRSRKDEILMLGDNMGDLLLDMPLVHFLEKLGHPVFYAVKEHPVQNDVSREDITHFGLNRMHHRIISTGVAHVGLAKEDMAGEIDRLWKGVGPVIAKGMGNFETLSEFDDERQVVYIMKVKCPAVASALDSSIGTYIARVR